MTSRPANRYQTEDHPRVDQRLRPYSALRSAEEWNSWSVGGCALAGTVLEAQILPVNAKGWTMCPSLSGLPKPDDDDVSPCATGHQRVEALKIR